MKKFFLTLFLLFSLLPSLCFAAQPTVSSDSRTFNPMTGVYDLKGNVLVKLPVNGSEINIKADAAQLALYSLEVHGAGNIALSFTGLTFNCDLVDVFISQNTAYVYDNCKFLDGATTITSDKGSYCWKTKLAAFSGNVMVNGKPVAGDVQYNVNTKKLQ